MKHLFHLFALTTDHSVKEDIIHWLWISQDGYLGSSVDSYIRNLQHSRFVRPEWTDDVNKCITHLWSSPRFQQQILYTIYECNESVPQMLYLGIDYDDQSHVFSILNKTSYQIYHESMYDCLEDMDKLQQFCQYLETYFRSQMLNIGFMEKLTT